LPYPNDTANFAGKKTPTISKTQTYSYPEAMEGAERAKPSSLQKSWVPWLPACSVSTAFLKAPRCMSPVSLPLVLPSLLGGMCALSCAGTCLERYTAIIVIGREI